MTTRHHTFFSTLIASAGLAALPIAAAASGLPPCPGDADGNLAVDLTDLNLVLADFGQSGPNLPGDVDDSGSVDLTDLNLVLAGFGPCTLPQGPQYPDPEVWQIGLEYIGPSGPLFLDADLYDTLDAQLTAIRLEVPDLADQTATPAWSPFSMIVAVPTAPLAPQVEQLNAYFQLDSFDLLFEFSGTSYYVAHFPQRLNIPAVVQIYNTTPGVTFAEPDLLIGGENFYEPQPLAGNLWRWNIDDGFLDCFDGCDCHYYYVIDVDAVTLTVNVLSVDPVGPSYCPFEF